MHAPGVAVDHVRQLVGVGAAQLGETAILQNDARQFVLVGDGFQRFLVGRGLASWRLQHGRQLEFVEQQGLQLLGRVEVEGTPGQLGGFLLRGQHALGQVGRLAAQFVAIDHHAVVLDAFQHRHQRHFNLAIHALEARLKAEAIDVTIPGTPVQLGHRHPMNKALDEAKDIFISMSFKILDGPEVELADYNFTKLNIDENPATAAKYGVMSIPTLNVYQGGEVAKTIVGAKPKAAIVRDLEAFIAE